MSEIMTKPRISSFKFSPLVIFSLIIFLVSVGDAVMSYLSPIYIEKHVPDSFIMGIVISFSSIVGFLCDLYIPKVFSGKDYDFFSWATLISAILFPISFLLFPPYLPVFLLGMFIWGIYYELLHFSQFHFINRFLPSNQFANGWGVLSAFKSAAYLLGPIIAVFILKQGFALSFSSAIIFFVAGAFGLLVFTRTTVKKHPNVLLAPATKLPISHIIRVWKVLWPKIWPLYTFLFFISIVDSVFWTIGTVLSEELRTTSFIGGLLLPAYSLPALFIPLFTQKIAKPAGKKRAAFITAAISGLLLTPMGFVKSPEALVAVVFGSSIFLSLSFPEIFAAFEDYVKRLGRSGDEMIGLQSSAISLSYIIGPIAGGALADRVGNGLTFTIFGLAIFVVSLLALVIVPRKIRLPEAKLASI